MNKKKKESIADRLLRKAGYNPDGSLIGSKSLSIKPIYNPMGNSIR